MNKSKKLLSLLLFIGLLSTNGVAGGCIDEILTPDDKDTKVKYFDKHFKLKKMECKRRGVPQYWELPQVSGKECAKPKVDGCNISNKAFNFAARDRSLMTPSCNALDLCYSTFGLTKEHCDNEFKANLESTAGRWGGTYSVRIPYAAVVKDGNTTYNDGQAWGKENCQK